MSLGFSAVNHTLIKINIDQALPSDIFQIAANSFLDAVGASTGPLYATAFKNACGALKGRELLDIEGQMSIIVAITEGIRHRGKGQRGDKTMLDTWIPAMEAAIKAKESDLPLDEMWDHIIVAAQKGCDSTKSMVATRGRAARLGERSLGHIDPGAASAVIILREMAKAFTNA